MVIIVISISLAAALRNISVLKNKIFSKAEDITHVILEDTF